MNEIKSPSEIMQIANAFRESRVLLSGYELGIFSILGDEHKTSIEVANAINADARATDRLMNALAAIGLLNKNKNKFSNTELTGKFLVKDKQSYMAGLGHTANLWHSWSTMTECIKQGKGVSFSSDINERGNDWLKSFIAAMHMRGRQAAIEAADVLDLSDVKSMLDVGGGSGAFTYEFLRRKPEIKAAIFDLPNVLPLTKQYIKSEGFEGKVNTVEGDYLENELGKGYDMIFLSAVIHSNSPEENINLFRKCSDALNKNGKIAVLDYAMNAERTEPYFGAMFALNMLVGTEKGDTYTEKEINEWLDKTGFKFESKKETSSGTAMVIGRKKN